MSRSKSLAARLGLVADHGDAEGELDGIGMPITERGESQDSAHEEAETQRLITSSMVSPVMVNEKSVLLFYLCLDYWALKLIFPSLGSYSATHRPCLYTTKKP